MAIDHCPTLWNLYLKSINLSRNIYALEKDPHFLTDSLFLTRFLEILYFFDLVKAGHECYFEVLFVPKTIDSSQN